MKFEADDAMVARVEDAISRVIEAFPVDEENALEMLVVFRYFTAMLTRGFDEEFHEAIDKLYQDVAARLPKPKLPPNVN